MTALKPLEIYKLLPKTNCAECGFPTCLAFAQAVAASEKDASVCPCLPAEMSGHINSHTAGAKAPDGFTESIDALKLKVRAFDLKAIAPGLGAKYAGGRLTLHVLGREFHVDGSGAITSQCHINNWIQWLVLTYVSNPAPKVPDGRFVPFDELGRGSTTVLYFSKRCEEPLRVIADEHTDVFFELLGLFGGKEAEGYDSDYAVILRVLPNVPMLVLYWRAEEGFPSKLRVMFDPTADSYFPPELITGMGRGMVEMFQKIIPRHEKGVLNLPYV
jgi:Domain of unknown function (DUF3786)/Putative Fe-S cluster